MDVEDADVEKVDYLQPEIISKEKLVEIIAQKCPHIGQLHAFDHDSLVDLFYKNVAPMPQRKYRSNRRGRVMSRNQVLVDKRKRKHDEISSTNSNYKISEPGSSNNSHMTQPSGDRLRPPPSAINNERKVIRLGQSRKTSEGSGKSTSTSIKVTNSANIKVNNGPSNQSKPACEIGISQANLKTDRNPVQGTAKESKDAQTKPRITKIMPQASKAPSASKVKLKRPSATTFEELAEDLGSEPIPCTQDVISAQPTQNEPDVQKGTDGALQTHHSPVNNGNAKAGCTETHEKQTEKNEETESPTDEGNLRKKFKRIAVTWP